MQNILDEEKEKLKNKIKKFLEKNEINYKETQKEIEIETELKSIKLTPYTEIQLITKENRKLIIKDMVSVIEIHSNTRIQISKSSLLLFSFKINFEKNKLVFKF